MQNLVIVECLNSFGQVTVDARKNENGKIAIILLLIYSIVGIQVF